MTIYMHTSSAGGVVIHGDKVLTISSQQWGSIDFPKGTVEDGESLEETAIREVEEETGYRTRVTNDLGSITYDFDGKDGRRYRKTVSYFLMELTDENEPVKNLQPGEDFINQWRSFEDALALLTHEEPRLILKKALQNV